VITLELGYDSEATSAASKKGDGHQPCRLARDSSEPEVKRGPTLRVDTRGSVDHC
jgi:hypothetical protein